MTTMPFSRRDLLKAGGVMIVGFSASGVPALAAPSARSLKPGMLDSWLVISRDNMVTVYSGRIDMGTGLQTAYAQIVADELDVPLVRIQVIMGDTTATPDQGKTTASSGIMVGAQPIRVAACEARAVLIKMAAEQLKVSAAELEAKDGAVRVRSARRWIAGRGGRPRGSRSAMTIVPSRVHQALDFGFGQVLARGGCDWYVKAR
jgi:CO/xanthine dehydrogenase Mo-binding subunit